MPDKTLRTVGVIYQIPLLYADTGMEFPEMYAHIAQLDAYLYGQRGMACLELPVTNGSG